MGIHAPIPIHQASDSRAYVEKANSMLKRHNRRSKRRGKPFGIQKDGDLWEVWLKAAEAKGFDSIKVGWTKGHAKEKDIREERSDDYCKRNNDEADEVADLGIEQGYPKGTLQLCE